MTAIVKQSSLPAEIERVLIRGDLSKLSERDRISYYNMVCESVRLNPLTKPFDYIVLNQKLVLYANKTCTDQLRESRKISINVTSREKIGDVYVVTARAKSPDGREDESTGAVHIGTAKGDALANLYMKAETKAKRRVTLSICGLGMLDESEVETIPSAKKPEVIESTGEVVHVLPSERVIEYGKKYVGRKYKEFSAEEIESYVHWIETNAEEKGRALNASEEKFLKDAYDYLLEINPEVSLGVEHPIG